MERHVDYVLRTVSERDVGLIRLWFTDVLGQLKSFAITAAELEHAFTDGMGFDGSAIDGFSRTVENDLLVRPDASTFELLPWTGRRDTEARMFCDVTELDGTPHPGDPRQVLRRHLDAAKERGLSFLVGPEMEFFYFAEASGTTPPTPLDHGSYFDLTTSDITSELRKRTIQALETMGIPVEYSFHEDSPSQHEIDLRHTDALSMADNVMTFRLMVREIALEAGVHATFMPKPMPHVQGSGMHIHLSLFSDDGNVFADGDDPLKLSATARSFVAGLLRHAPEMTAVTNQLVNSYKRLVTGSEAPSYVTWARSNRSALVRVPPTRPGREDSVRLEFRSPDSACNPYLVFSLLLAAGMRGIDAGYELAEQTDDDLAALDEAEVAARGIGSLPRSLAEALDTMASSALVREALGEHIFTWFLRNKRSEWADYRAQVTPFELERYLPVW
ncbi:MAG: type I glutamate--ammonia ligase [Actinobacteria bacterium]|nr:type I glutamate--ammonia ligase [Actinomycetota bacterium]